MDIQKKPVHRIRVPVSTTMDEEQYWLVKNNRWKLCDIIALGCGVKAKHDKQGEELGSLQQAQDNLLKTIKNLRTRVQWLETMQKENEADKDEDKNTE
jgi:hypothetical protein